ncbi:MAG: DUF1854 domain-containing protein [Planctomycetota bacterium]
MHPSSPAPNRTSSTATPDWRLERGEHGRLDFIDASGRRHTDVDVVRAFPISAAAGPVAIVGTEGDELAWIDPLADLDAPLRSLLEKELSQREFLPVIERIESVSDGEPTEWSVVTDRGPRRFTVAHVDDIVYSPDGGAYVTDAVGVRYHISNVSRLDGRSRRLLDRMD